MNSKPAGTSSSGVDYHMTFLIDYSKSRFDMDQIVNVLGLPVPKEGTLDSTLRAQLQMYMDDQFRSLTPRSFELYNLFGLRPYWFRLDDLGNIIDGWIDIKGDDHHVYVPHEHVLQVPPISIFTRPAGTKPTMVSLAVENGELKTAHRIISHMSFRTYRTMDACIEKLDSRVRRLEAQGASGTASVPDALLKDVADLKGSVQELSQLKQSVENLAAFPPQGGISDELRQELNFLGKGMRKHVLVVHNATVVGTPKDDADLVLSQLGSSASFGEFRAFRRGRKVPNSRLTPILAIMFTSEVMAMKALDAFMSYRKTYLQRHPNGRLPFRFEQDMPKAVVAEVIRLNKIVAAWRDKKLGDLRRHGDKIVYFANGKYVADVVVPKGPGPYADPILPGDPAVLQVEGELSVYERMQRAPPRDVTDADIVDADEDIDTLLATAALKAALKGKKRDVASSSAGPSYAKRVMLLPPNTPENYQRTGRFNRSTSLIETSLSARFGGAANNESDIYDNSDIPAGGSMPAGHDA